jgi:hypothetical protein
MKHSLFRREYRFGLPLSGALLLGRGGYQGFMTEHPLIPEDMKSRTRCKEWLLEQYRRGIFEDNKNRPSVPSIWWGVLQMQQTREKSIDVQQPPPREKNKAAPDVQLVNGQSH